MYTFGRTSVTPNNTTFHLKVRRCGLFLNINKIIKMSIANKQVDVILLMTVNGGWFTAVVFRDGVPEMVATS